MANTLQRQVEARSAFTRSKRFRSRLLFSLSSTANSQSHFRVAALWTLPLRRAWRRSRHILSMRFRVRPSALLEELFDIAEILRIVQPAVIVALEERAELELAGDERQGAHVGHRAPTGRNTRRTDYYPACNCPSAAPGNRPSRLPSAAPSTRRANSPNVQGLWAVLSIGIKKHCHKPVPVKL